MKFVSRLSSEEFHLLMTGTSTSHVIVWASIKLLVSVIFITMPIYAIIAKDEYVLRVLSVLIVVGLYIGYFAISEIRARLNSIRLYSSGPLNCIQEFSFGDNVLKISGDDWSREIGKKWIDNCFIMHNLVALRHGGTPLATFKVERLSDIKIIQEWVRNNK